MENRIAKLERESTRLNEQLQKMETRLSERFNKDLKSLDDKMEFRNWTLLGLIVFTVVLVAIASH